MREMQKSWSPWPTIVSCEEPVRRSARRESTGENSAYLFAGSEPGEIREPAGRKDMLFCWQKSKTICFGTSGT